MTEENVDEEYAPAFVEDTNINTFEFFAPLLDQMPYLSIGLRWESLHGEAWRFADLEILIMGLVYSSSNYEYWDEIDEHILVFEETYIKAPKLSEKSKEALQEMLIFVRQLKNCCLTNNF